jgi:ADP-ribosylglycohydrolase
MTLPTDHETRMDRARLALDGLSVGDGFGANVFDPNEPDCLRRRRLPPPGWRYTDDTAMALGIVEVLQRHGRIDQDELVRVFARRFREDPNRGYGPSCYDLLRQYDFDPTGWREKASAPVHPRHRSVLVRLRNWLSQKPAGPGGSLGNGGAMRVAPVGAYFAEDVVAVETEASASAEVTHAHPDGMAGAVAVAVAAAWAWRCRSGTQEHTREGLLDHVLEHTPEGQTHTKLLRARTLPADTKPDDAARELGNGNPITSAETVPFTIWTAARHMGDFTDALWTTASVGGDMDTTCAIVGGIVALSCGREGIPAEWLASREALTL